MPALPPEFVAIMIAFQPLFSKPVSGHATVLVIGAILAPGCRTVAAALRMMGLSQTVHFQNYHRVLNRARWSARAASQILLGLLLKHFAGQGQHRDDPLVFGLDETIERRWGKKIKARGIYRDAVRSSKGHFVKTSGLRWISMMLLCEIPWAARIWALPFLTVLAPSERYHQEQGRSHKKLTDYARQMIIQLRRWLPDWYLVVVCDSTYAALEFLAAASAHAVIVTRLRLDAALYEPAPARKPGQLGAPRKKGERLPTLERVLHDSKSRWQAVVVSHWYSQKNYTVEITTGTCVWYHSGMPVVPIRWVLVRDPSLKLKPKAFLCTDQAATPRAILCWFVRRWQVEVTFEEVRRHLGVETQRQWSDLAIARTTPCLLGLFSVVTLLAHELYQRHGVPVRQASWYRKTVPSFSDALAAVRGQFWRQRHYWLSCRGTETMKIPKTLFESMTEALCYAA